MLRSRYTIGKRFQTIRVLTYQYQSNIQHIDSKKCFILGVGKSVNVSKLGKMSQIQKAIFFILIRSIANDIGVNNRKRHLFGTHFSTHNFNRKRLPKHTIGNNRSIGFIAIQISLNTCQHCICI